MDKSRRKIETSKKPKNLEKIQESFSSQASKFEKENMNFSKESFLDYTVKNMELCKSDTVFEAAAGTAACGRAIAPFVNSVTCLDATESMLEVGKEKAEKENLSNISFKEGVVEDIPFPDETFDIVISRLGFHHFMDIERPFQEMNRVLKKAGKLVIIDMEAAPEEIREVQDSIEILRDSSHVKNISNEEFVEMYKNNNFNIIKNETTEIEVSLEAWMELTNTPLEAKKKIKEKMENDIRGENKTGFNPSFKGDEIHFIQRWMLVIGKK